jgi:pimeloyl-ACP methyl ester carboxylesterase
MELNHLTRRTLLSGVGMTGGLATLGMGLGQLALAADMQEAAQAGGKDGGEENGPRAWYELGMLEDHILEQVLLFYLSHTWHGMADISECLDAASRVRRGERWSWANSWEQTAERVQAMAEGYLADGHDESAGQAFMRSSNYYIACMHRHPDRHDPNIQTMTRASLDCFSRGLQLLRMPVEEVRIPYEDTHLPGYFYRSPLASKQAPTMIIFNGRDAWAVQDNVLAQAGIRRGYHVLLFDGPGQGPVLRLQGLPFRPDWEKVITPVVDFALGLKGVDPARIGVMGLSMGGFLSPRAACFEHRPKVYVANPPVVNWGHVTDITIRQMVGDDGIALVDSDPAAFDALIDELGKRIPLVEWGMDDTVWKHGVNTAAEVMVDMRRYDISEEARNIKSRMLFLHGVADEWAQVDWIQKLLPEPGHLELFTPESTGQLHCQTGAWSIMCERMYNWLDDNLKA